MLFDSNAQLFNILKHENIVKIRSKSPGYSVCLYSWDYANENYQVYSADYVNTLEEAQALEKHYIKLFVNATK
jgi:hypothetical protein